MHQTSPSVSGNFSGSLQAQQSLLQRKTSPPVPPPPPRRRPESFQVLSSPMYNNATGGGPGGGVNVGIGLPPLPDAAARGATPNRRASIQSSATHSTDASGTGGDAAEKEKEKGGGAGDAFANLYESVKKRAGGIQKGAVQPSKAALDNTGVRLRRMAERAEGRVVPGGYIHPRRGTHHGAPERRGLVDGANDEDDYDGRGGGGGWDAGGGGGGDDGFGVDSDPASPRAGSPGVDVDDSEWREWDRTIRANSDGRRGRQRLSNGPGMDDGEGGDEGPFVRASSQGDGWRRL